MISMMATIPYGELKELVQLKEEQVARTVPLPSTSRREGPILLYPAESFANELLTAVGTPVAVSTEAEITKMVFK